MTSALVKPSDRAGYTRLAGVLVIIVTAWFATIQPVEATASAVAQNDSTWIDPVGTLHIFGEVKNTGDLWLHGAKITGTLRNASSGIVDTLSTYASAMFLPPGSTSPFEIIELDTTKSAQVQTYLLVVEFSVASAVDQKLVIRNVADSKNSKGWLEVVGEVLNQGDALSIDTKVTGTFYDSNGKVIYAIHNLTSPRDVPAGYMYGFRITVSSDERTSKITRYSLIAESQDSGYTSIPELSAPMLLAGIVLSLGFLATRRKPRNSTDAGQTKSHSIPDKARLGVQPPISRTA